MAGIKDTKEQWGSVKLFKGRWRARLKGGKYLGLYDSEAEAWEEVEASRRQIEGTGPWTLARFGNRYLDDREKAGDTRSIASERSIFKNHILTADFAEWPLRKIAPLAIQQWVNTLVRKHAKHVTASGTGNKAIETSDAEKTLSAQTIRHAKRLLNGMFEQAKIEGKIAENPSKGIKLPKMDRVIEDEDHWTFLAPAEIDRLFGALPSERLRAFYAVAIYGGLRRGEILGLRWEDLVFDGARSAIKVRRTRNHATKSLASRRTVPMLPEARAALLAWRDHGGVTRVAGLCFPNASGELLHKGYDGQWRDEKSRDSQGALIVVPGFRTKAGLVGKRGKIRFHDLRHTCASHLVQGTWGRAWTLYEVMHWLGHTALKMTQRYAHLAPDALLGQAATLETTRIAEAAKLAGLDLVGLGNALEQAK